MFNNNIAIRGEKSILKVGNSRNINFLIPPRTGSVKDIRNKNNWLWGFGENQETKARIIMIMV